MRKSKGVRAASLTAILLAGTAAWTAAQTGFYDRSEIPGHYTLGLYASADGDTSLVIDRDQTTATVHIGITGDSTRVFSGAAFDLEFPYGVEMNGPVIWKAIDGLKEWGSVDGDGLQVEFAKECQVQVGPRPAILGRFEILLDEKFQSGEIAVVKHFKFGLSVELCDPDHAWPKPYAEAVSLSIERKRGFWQRIRDLFG